MTDELGRYKVSSRIFECYALDTEVRADLVEGIVHVFGPSRNRTVRLGREQEGRDAQAPATREGSLNAVSSPGAESVDSGRIDAYDPVAVRLCRLSHDANVVSAAHDRPSDGDRRQLEVDVSPLQPDRFAATCPGHCGHSEQDLEPGVGGVQDRRDPFGWDRRDVGDWSARWARVSGHVLRYEPPSAGLLQRGSHDRVQPAN